jgi:hypothetical protein
MLWKRPAVLSARQNHPVHPCDGGRVGSVAPRKLDERAAAMTKAKTPDFRIRKTPKGWQAYWSNGGQRHTLIIDPLIQLGGFTPLPSLGVTVLWDFGRPYHRHDNDDRWVWSETGEPYKSPCRKVRCPVCNKCRTRAGHDPCIPNLPGVVNACCGHGKSSGGYIEFVDGRLIRFHTTTIEQTDWTTETIVTLVTFPEPRD